MFYGDDHSHKRLAREINAVSKWINRYEKINGGNGAIAVRGLSGILVGAPVAHKLNKTLYIIRKSGENTHGRNVEILKGDKTHNCYYIIDDFAASGATVQIIMTQMAGILTPAAIICYTRGTSSLAKVNGVIVFDIHTNIGKLK